MKFPFEEKSLLYHELSKLSASGFPLPEAIDTVADTHPPEATMEVLLGVKAGLAEGKSIGEAFASAADGSLSDLEESIIAASERGGVLADGFEHLSEYYQMRATTAAAIRRKMVYPLVLLHFAIFIPVIPLMIGAEHPARVLAVSGLTLLAVYLLLFGVIVVGRRLALKAESDPKVDRKLARVPLLGSVRQNLSLARFSSVFRMHLLAGERIDESLRSAASASRSGRIREAVETGAIPSVENGQPVGPELAKRPDTFTAAFARGFITAENSGTLDSDLLRWSDRFHEGARSAMDKLGTHAPKYFYALIVIIALWQVFRMVAKIFSGYDQIFQLINF
ncbi:MAG: type II secretion system F family protein [Verrucomicrobiales bacterium]